MEVGARSGSSRPQRSALSQAAKDARHWLRDYITAIKHGRIHPFSPPERVARAATRNEPWGPTGEQLRAVTALCDGDEASRAIVFAVLETRLRVQTPTKWRNPFKALSAVEFLLKRADEQTVADLVSDDRRSLRRVGSAASSRSGSFRNLAAADPTRGAPEGGAPAAGAPPALAHPSGTWLTATPQAASTPALTRSGSYSASSFGRGASGLALDGALPAGAPPALPRNAIAFLAAALAAPGGAMRFEHADNPSSAPGSIAREAAVVVHLLSDPEALAAARDETARLRERDRAQASVAGDGWGPGADGWDWVAQQQRQHQAPAGDAAETGSLGNGGGSVSSRSSPSRPPRPGAGGAAGAPALHPSPSWAASPMDPTTPLDGAPSPIGAPVTSTGVYGARSFREGADGGERGAQQQPQQQQQQQQAPYGSAAFPQQQQQQQQQAPYGSAAPAPAPQTSQVDMSPAAASARRFAALETLAADRSTGGGCADCGEAVWAKPGPYPVVFFGLPPSWASPSAGVFLCNACAVAHRAAGAGEVRPVSMPDMWTAAEVSRLARAGNVRANAHWLGAVGGTASGIADVARPADPTARLEHVRRKYLDLRWAEGAWPPQDVPPQGTLGRRILEDLRDDLIAEGVSIPGVTAPEEQPLGPRVTQTPFRRPGDLEVPEGAAGARVDWTRFTPRDQKLAGGFAAGDAGAQPPAWPSSAQQQAVSAPPAQPSAWPSSAQQQGAPAPPAQPSAWPSSAQQASATSAAALPTSPAPSLSTDLRRLEDFASALENESGLVSAAQEAGAGPAPAPGPEDDMLADMTRLEGSMASGTGSGLAGAGAAEQLMAADPSQPTAEEALIEGLSSLGVSQRPATAAQAYDRDADIVSASDLSEPEALSTRGSGERAASGGSSAAGSASGSPRRAPARPALQTIAEESSGRMGEASLVSEVSAAGAAGAPLPAGVVGAPTAALGLPAAAAAAASPWPSAAGAGASPWPSAAAASSPWPSGAPVSAGVASPWPSAAAPASPAAPSAWPSSEGSGLAALEAAGAAGLASGSLLAPGQSRGAAYASPEPPTLAAPSLPSDAHGALNGTPSPEDESVSSESSPPPKSSVARKGSSASKLAGRKQARFLTLRELAAVRASTDA